MKSLVLAGILSLTVHGALLLATLDMHARQPPRSLQEVIYIDLGGLPEDVQARPTNKTTAQQNDAILPSKELARQVNRQKQPATPQNKKKKQDDTPTAIDPEIQQVTEEEISSFPGSIDENERQQSYTSAALLTADPPGLANTAQQSTEAIPIYRKNPPPEYPALARQRGQEGTAILDVLVSSLGTSDQIRIAQTSGHDLLDQAAVTAVENWVFLPGKKGEHPVQMWVRVPIRFALHD